MILDEISYVWSVAISHAAGLWLFAAVGTVISWSKLKKAEREIYSLTPILQRMIRKNTELRELLEVIIFVAIGCALAIKFTNPSTPIQAFTAGLGWTTLAATTK